MQRPDMTVEISPLQIVAEIVRRRRTIVGIPVAVAAVVMAVTLFNPPKYTAWMAFTPDQEAGQLSAIAGVAADFGVNLPTGDNTQSPQFYVELIQGRAFLEQLVAKPFVVPSGDSMAVVRLDTLLGTTDPDSSVAKTLTGQELGHRLLANVSASSGITTVTLTLQSPQVAKAVLERVLAQLQEFDVTTRQTRARFEREFIERRATEAAESLRVAEAASVSFLMRNRDIRGSPELQFEADRLQRAVSLRQGLLTGLLQSLEQARIDQVRSEPRLTLVERPSVSVLPDRRRLVLKGLLAVIGSLCALLVGLVVQAYYRHAVEENGAIGEEIADETRRIRERWASRVNRLMRRSSNYDASK